MFLNFEDPARRGVGAPSVEQVYIGVLHQGRGMWPAAKPPCSADITGQSVKRGMPYTLLNLNMS